MTDEAVKRARMAAHAACEERTRPGDASREWLGVMLAVGCAVVVAALLGWAAWDWF